MDMGIFAVPRALHLRPFEPLYSQEVQQTLDRVPQPTAYFLAVLLYNCLRQMRRAWAWHYAISFEMGFYSESLERVTLPLRTQRPCEERFWQVDLEYVREKIQDWEVRIDMGQECITWQQN